MAYRHYAGFGQTEQTAAPKPPDGFTTDISTAYITPSEQTAVPSPSPLDIEPKPGDLVPMPSPAPPIVPMPPMTTPLTPMGPTSTTQRPLISSEGVLGIPWRWVFGGAFVGWLVRSYFANKKVTPNRRRRRR